MYQQDMAYECVINRDNGVLGRVVFPVLVTIAIATFIFFLNFIPMLFGANIIYFTGLVSLGICYLVYYKFKAFNNTEYEIEFLNEYFTAAKVQRQKKRTELAEFSLRDCNHIGPVTEDCFNEYLKSAGFTLNLTTNRKYEINDQIWFCNVNGNGFTYNVILEFKNPMYKFFRRFNPRNVFIMPMPKEEPEESFDLKASEDGSDEF